MSAETLCIGGAWEDAARTSERTDRSRPSARCPVGGRVRQQAHTASTTAYHPPLPAERRAG